MAYQTASSGSMIAMSAGLPAICSRTRTGNRPLLPFTTTKPKVLSSPRIVLAVAWRCDTRRDRATSKHAQGMRIHTFDRDLAIPAGANHLRQAERVIRVSFVDLQAERTLGVPGVHADYGHAASAQAEGQPVGELSGLQTNPHRAGGMLAHCRGKRVGA